MTDDPADCQFSAAIDASDGGDKLAMTVKSDTPSDFHDYSSSPYVELTFTAERERMTVTLEQALNDQQTTALIDALTAALARSRAEAKKRGYYSWVDEGRPEYGPPYEAMEEGRLSPQARSVLEHLMSDPDGPALSMQQITAGLPAVQQVASALQELTEANYVEATVTVVGETAYAPTGAAWITSGTRRS